MSLSQEITVEVAFALPRRQYLLELRVALGTTAAQAVALAHGQEPQIPDDSSDIGIFGRPVGGDYVLEAGDRVEIYRPLEIDPKEARRRAAAARRR